MNLSENVKITLVQAALADGQTDPDSSSVDMAGFDGVMFVGIVGTITGSGTANLVVAQSSDDGSTDAYNSLTGLTVTATAAAQSDRVLVLDCFRPTKRYVRTTLTRAVANSIWGGTLAIQYSGKNRPTVQDATTVLTAVLAASPVEL
jgi:hypothetical protein